jgi:hypothetical protein
LQQMYNTVTSLFAYYNSYQYNATYPVPWFTNFSLTTYTEVNTTSPTIKTITDVRPAQYTTQADLLNAIARIVTKDTPNTCAQPAMHAVRAAITNICYDGTFGACPLANDTTAPPVMNPHSPLILFTDAPASDVDYMPYVVDMATKAFVQVYVVITPASTPGCSSIQRDDNDYSTFRRLAQLTGGMVIYATNQSSISSALFSLFQDVSNSSVTKSWGVINCIIGINTDLVY